MTTGPRPALIDVHDARLDSITLSADKRVVVVFEHLTLFERLD
jgi:hypothetical protein